MKIINDGYPKDDQILLDTLTAEYYQENDCTEDRTNGEGQVLTITTRDGGGGKFFHIKTNGWSFENAEELSRIILDFSKRIYGNTDNT